MLLTAVTRCLSVQLCVSVAIRAAAGGELAVQKQHSHKHTRVVKSAERDESLFPAQKSKISGHEQHPQTDNDLTSTGSQPS